MGILRFFRLKIVIQIIKKDSNTNYKGSEYLTIYPRIIKYTDGDKYSDGSYITPGYYISTLQKDGHLKIKELSKWFEI